MPKCVRCGKKGLFLKTSKIGICQKCEKVEEEERQKEILRKHNEELKREMEEQERLKKEQEEKKKAETLERIKAKEDEQKRREKLFADTIDEIPKAEITQSETPSEKQSFEFVDNITYSNITKTTPRDKLGNFVVVDVETTGLKRAYNEIVEIAAIRFRNYEPVEAFTSLCKPKKPITPEITQINGIGNSMVEHSPNFSCIAKSFQEFIECENIVGHNLPFDLGFIARGGVDLSTCKRKYYDTLSIAQRTLKKVKNKWDKELECYMPNTDADYDVENYKLETLCRYYGILHCGAHRAMADALVTGVLLDYLAKDRE